MVATNYRVLVVDDESVVRQLTMRALAREGFFCDAAENGDIALRQMARSHYDVVVTDLSMPQKHGHALATELLALPDRPLVVVLTGVIEPRLAKDLMARGVDDIVFKPVDYSTFAAKIKALTNRHVSQRTAAEGPNPAAQPAAAGGSPASSFANDSPPVAISLAELEGQLALVSRIMPMSPMALEVFALSSLSTSSPQQLATVIQCDASLAAELLRLANSSFYNRGGQKIVEIGRAHV